MYASSEGSGESAPSPSRKCDWHRNLLVHMKKKIVYLKIPVGKNANEDTKHNSIYKHGRRQCSLSRMFKCRSKNVLKAYVERKTLRPKPQDDQTEP